MVVVSISENLFIVWMNTLSFKVFKNKNLVRKYFNGIVCKCPYIAFGINDIYVFLNTYSISIPRTNQEEQIM